MAYADEADKLFLKWRKKNNHINAERFNRDGIVNFEKWDAQEKKILFVLKEAYGEGGDYDLCAELAAKGPWGNIWNRVAEWTYGILNTTENEIAPYTALKNETPNTYLNKIAVMNIKKSNGKPMSDNKDLMSYAEEDCKELAEQFGLINPDVVVCGYTFDFINFALGMTIDKTNNPNENWYYYDQNGRIFIDFFHPASQYPALLSYYGIANIYQQALKHK